MTLLHRLSISGAIVLSISTTAAAQRSIPNPIYGVTFDDVSQVSAETKALASIVKVPTVRVVFDKGEPPSYYKGPITQFRTAAYIMGEIVDSSEMKRYKTISVLQTRTSNYINTLGSLVDVWEVGNEVNGDWLGTSVMQKIEAMYDIVAASGGKTAITFFYEGETSESHNCIDSQGGMFPWIQKSFLDKPTQETEKIRLGLNYALISWYPDQCMGERPDWAAVFTRLSQIFPNAKVGFGEIGTANPQGGSVYERNEIMTYYPLANTLTGLPPTYVGGYFFWYFAEIGVPWPGSDFLDLTLNSALMVGP